MPAQQLAWNCETTVQQEGLCREKGGQLKAVNVVLSRFLLFFSVNFSK